MKTSFINSLEERLKWLREEAAEIEKLIELYRRNEGQKKYIAKPPPMRFRAADPRYLKERNPLYRFIDDAQKDGRLAKWFMVKDLVGAAPEGPGNSMSSFSVGLHHLYRRHVLAILKLKGTSRASLYTSDLKLIHYNNDLGKWEADPKSIPDQYLGLFQEADVEVLFLGQA